MMNVKADKGVFAIAMVLIFSSCYNTTRVNELPKIKQEVTIIKNDTLQLKSTIINFLFWYKNNYKKASAYPILARDNDSNFMVNHNAYISYLDFISSSNFVSPRYTAYWQVYFNDKEMELKNEPVKTFEPEGFDFDFVLIKQKPEEILDRLANIKYSIISMNDSTAMVGLKLTDDESSAYEFEMYKEKSAWKIGYISTPDYD